MPPRTSLRARPTQTTTQTKPLSIFTVGAIAFGLAAVWVYPLFTGVIALLLAAASRIARDRMAKTALIFAVVGPIAGFLLHLLPESFLQ